MEEELAMLRQLIGQLQELLHLYGSPPPPPPLPSFSTFPPPHTPPLYVLRHPEDRNGWCLPCIEEGSADDCCDIVMAAGKRSGVFKMLESVKSPPAKKSRKELSRGKSSTEETNSDENMDQNIWQEFPEDLFEAILSRLPVATFFRFRSVCQKWNSLTDSENFSERCAEVPQTIPWFYTITHENVNSGAVYDPCSKKWHHPVISALPKRTIVLPVASAGGLVCFLDIGHRNFYLCNPLTKSFRELPARSFKVWSRIAVGMILNGKSTSDGYKVMWVGCEGEYEVYDSTRNAWTKRGSMPSSIKLPVLLNFKSQPVAIGSSLYFMLTEPEGILSYNMVTGTWKQSIIPAPMHLSDHTLAECGDQLMLVGLLTKNAATCVCIWELQKMTLLWKEVDRMPNVWCLEFYGKHIRMNCLGNKGCLIMLSLRSRQMNRLVTYNVGTREWSKVPGYSAPPRGRKRLWITGGTAFHPSPTATA
ncbi:PREDICTED: F-box only protein 6-like [Tarenaya hassleriana]|uniref:F-box only protein 6-like n=1 Tax=Tarenaya hassleriana TaxID=28532 RepID=UPI00053C5B20|nr:PREDICTED: F-box only protein 6-like [Tarenaya hassleriana]XP_010530554.1 PREDICTED: F-box only protein 6-like [Tarenaya hassleriana]